MPDANPVLKKLLYKGQSPVLLTDAPAEFEAVYINPCQPLLA